VWQKYPEIILGILIWTFVSILLLIEQSSYSDSRYCNILARCREKLATFSVYFRAFIYWTEHDLVTTAVSAEYITSHFFTGDDFVFIKYMAEWSRLAWERLSERAIIDVLNGERRCVTANGCNDCNIAAWIQIFYSLSLSEIYADRLRYWSSVLPNYCVTTIMCLNVIKL